MSNDVLRSASRKRGLASPTTSSSGSDKHPTKDKNPKDSKNNRDSKDHSKDFQCLSKEIKDGKDSKDSRPLSKDSKRISKDLTKDSKDSKDLEEVKKDKKNQKGKDKDQDDLDLTSLSIIQVDYEDSSSDSFDADAAIDDILQEPNQERQVEMLRASMRKRLPYFDYISDAVILNIYIHSEAEDMMRLGLTCRRLFYLTADKSAWDSRLGSPINTNKASYDLRAFYAQQYTSQNRIRKLQDAAARRQDGRSGSAAKGHVNRVLDRVLFFK